MILKSKGSRSASAVLVIIAAAALLTGIVYYLVFRSQTHSLLGNWIGLPFFKPELADPSVGTLPSFLHMLTLTCLAVALIGSRRGLIISSGLLAMTVVAEFTLGVFDPADLLMAVSGYLLALVLSVQIFRHFASNGGHHQTLSQRQSLIAATSLVVCSGFFIGATAPCVDCGYNRTNATPVYLSYMELRRAVQVESPRELQDIGRLYVYRDYLFLNRRNEGIHVIDNTDPASPENVLFIAIPGNTELSIRQNFLYADSYVDLVTLDLNDPMNIQEINRQQEIFPWDEYQNVPDDIYFNYSDIDKNRGVVVSYE